VVNSQFWRNKRVFLTGHTGFKGSWMSLWLQSLGAELTGYSLQPPTSPSLFEVAGVADGMVSILGDVRDFDALLNAIRQAKPEIVIHMAAQPLVRYSYANPVETYATNVMGVVHLLESIRQVQGVRAVVNVTTDKCYENKEWLWSYRENESMGGYDPYSNSKGCAELVTSAFRNSYFNPETYQQHGVALGSARAGNV
jgi:CDP-glucose 4,6-dehydratase